jgi:non-ribosomal peptide synthetase component F
LLYGYAEAQVIPVLTGVANRNREELEPLIGFLVNTVVLTADFSGKPTFRELLRQMRETVLESYMHQELPFELLVEALRPERDTSYSPLSQVMFVMDNTPEKSLRLPDLQMTFLQTEVHGAKFDLTLFMAEDAHKSLRGVIEYNTDLFREATVERIVDELQTLFQQIVDNPDCEVVNYYYTTTKK